MWVRLRVRQRRWTKSEARADAPKDFEPRNESDEPSIFKVDSEEEARTFAAIWGAQFIIPQNHDFVVFDEAALGPLDATFADSPDLHPRLRERHYEIRGLHDEEQLKTFCDRVFENKIAVPRLRESEAVECLRELLENDASLGSCIAARWKELLNQD